MSVRRIYKVLLPLMIISVVSVIVIQDLSKKKTHWQYWASNRTVISTGTNRTEQMALYSMKDRMNQTIPDEPMSMSLYVANANQRKSYYIFQSPKSVR